MNPHKNPYTTIQIKKELNVHIKNFCKKYKVNASTITELMWANYISSSAYLTEIMTIAEPARSQLVSSSMSGSITL